MKLSIVTISFNQAEYLERTIQSVLKQKDINDEYIIVDPGSTDGSRDIIERYRDSFAHVLLEPDQGPADGLNKGFSKASGDWFAYLNSDDLYEEGGLAKARQAIASAPSCGALIGDGVIIDKNDAVTKRAFSSPFSLFAARYGEYFALQQSTLYRADAFRKVGGFNIDNRTCWDSEILIDIAQAGYAVRNTDASIGAFRIHSESITGSGRLTEKYLKDANRLRQKISTHAPSPIEHTVVTALLRAYAYISSPGKTIKRILDRLK